MRTMAEPGGGRGRRVATSCHGPGRRHRARRTRSRDISGRTGIGSAAPESLTRPPEALRRERPDLLVLADGPDGARASPACTRRRRSWASPCSTSSRPGPTRGRSSTAPRPPTTGSAGAALDRELPAAGGAPAPPPGAGDGRAPGAGRRRSASRLLRPDRPRPADPAERDRPVAPDDRAGDAPGRPRARGRPPVRRGELQADRADARAAQRLLPAVRGASAGRAEPSSARGGWSTSCSRTARRRPGAEGRPGAARRRADAAREAVGSTRSGPGLALAVRADQRRGGGRRRAGPRRPARRARTAGSSRSASTSRPRRRSSRSRSAPSCSSASAGRPPSAGGWTWRSPRGSASCSAARPGSTSTTGRGTTIVLDWPTRLAAGPERTSTWPWHGGCPDRYDADGSSNRSNRLSPSVTDQKVKATDGDRTHRSTATGSPPSSPRGSTPSRR